MKKIFLPILISIFCIPNLAKSQGNCGTYDGYLQDEMNKYPAFYKSIEEKNIQLEQKNKELVSNLNEKENINPVSMEALRGAQEIAEKSGGTVTAITFSLIIGNQDYGVYISDAPIINSTISTNNNGVYRVGDITNSIIFFNSNSQIDNHQGSIAYSNIMGDDSGEGNIDDNPAFLDYIDYELHPSSPCIDAGNPEAEYYNKIFLYL